MVKPADYPERTAERAVADFLLAWKKRKWDQAAAACQLTWVKAARDPVREITGRFGFMELVEARIAHVEKIAEPTFDVTVAIQYKFNRRFHNREIVARVICETAPFTPGVDGQWGVNPVSMMRGMTEEKTDAKENDRG